MGKIIVIEGTDCSGKETQSNLLVERLKQEGYKVGKISFPWYDSPTGKIVGACLLGKEQMCKDVLKENHSFFLEGGGEVDGLCAMMYYAADRRYHLPQIKNLLNNSDYLIIDRYTISNMAHRGSFLKTKEEREKIYRQIELLEYNILELPRPDQVIILYMPFEQGNILRQNRVEALDEAEKDEEYQRKSIQAYLELASLYNYDLINCVENTRIKNIQELHEEIYTKVRKR